MGGRYSEVEMGREGEMESIGKGRDGEHRERERGDGEWKKGI